MTASISRKPTQSLALLVVIAVTLLAMAAHRFLPERRLVIDSAREGANFFLVQSGNGAPVDEQWVDQSKFHFTCQFPQSPSMQGCGFAFMLAKGVASQGIDLSQFRTLNLAVGYTGTAQYLRVAIRNFDARFSKLEDLNSPKYNFVNIPTKDLAKPIAIDINEFSVGEWWTAMYDLPREYARPDLTNSTVLNIDLQGNLDGTRHEVRIDRLEFVGDWISVETWYFGILCALILLGVIYGVSQWLLLRRAHRQQIVHLEQEKQQLQKLSTVDALTNVLNRHGIEQFIAALGVTRVAASVIVVDIDHFKRVNDDRGHAVGDRVLRTMGDILGHGVRNTDGVGRWGGEEFVVVCPGASLSKAADLAEKLRHQIMATNFIPENPLPITASFGVATAAVDQDFEDAFRQADQALYLAKSRGRNCVVAASEDQMHKVTGARKGTLALVSGRFKLHK